MRTIPSIAIAALMLCFSVACAAPSRNVAFVVGNGGYENAGPLANPPRDARAIAAKLQGLGWSVHLAIDASRFEFEESARQFVENLEGADRAIFFYAGHGLQIDGENFIVPVEFGHGDSGLRSLVSLGGVIDRLSKTEAQLVVILDACRDSPLYASLTDIARLESTRGLKINRPEHTGSSPERARPQAQDLASRSDDDGQWTARISTGLAELDTRPGTLIAFATQPGNVALDGNGNHSPFTEALLAEIGDPNLDITTILRRTRKTVIRQTDGKQVPWDHSSLTRSFLVYEENTAPPPP